MPKATIDCPRCHGKIGVSLKGETLDVALARHEALTHGAGVAPRPQPLATGAAQPPAVKILRRRS